MQISILDIIVDRPGYMDLRKVAKDLERAVIRGHKVLRVQQTTQQIEDVIRIPHSGHSSACHSTPARQEACLSANPAGIKYERTFMLQLVVEGAVYLADWASTDFRMFGRSVMIMVSCVLVVAEVDDVDRFILTPWNTVRETA